MYDAMQCNAMQCTTIHYGRACRAGGLLRGGGGGAVPGARRAADQPALFGRPHVRGMRCNAYDATHHSGIRCNTS